MMKPIFTPLGFSARSAATQDASALHRQAEIAHWLTQRLLQHLPPGMATIKRDMPFDELGLDSLESVGLTGDLEEALSRRLSPNLLADYPTIDALSKHLSEMLADQNVVDLPVRVMAPGRPVGGFTEHPAYRELQEQLAVFDKLQASNPYFLPIDGVNGAVSSAGGREFTNFSSYNYVGLSGSPAVSRAAIEAIERMGTSASASRLASGEKPVHRELEREIASFIGVDDAIVYVGGHSTNMSTIACLVGPGDAIFHDALAHDSVLQGCRLSGARQIPFPHNDWQTLDALLTERRGRYRFALVVIEGVYSMDGDIPDLPHFQAVKQRHDAWLMVDEAHSLGVLGPTGRGLSEHHAVNPASVDVWMGTLSKSLASCGGYIAGSRDLIQLLKYRSHGFVYSAGMPPSNAAAALAALKALRAEPERVARLQKRVSYFLASARARSLDTGLSSGGAVVPIMVGATALCLQLTHAISRRGIIAHPMVHPAVAENAARLRFFITSEHTEAQIDTALDTIAAELKSLKKTSAMEGASA